MKSFTLACIIALFSGYSAYSQVVLNELYGTPGNGNHEFFELHNISTDNTPASVDGITIVTYFEEGATQGFYVLDLPSLFISPRGYFVGAAAIPFNYQSQVNSTNASFSWNDPALSTNNGFLQKWVLAGDDESDGNKYYNLATVPSNLNDFLYKRGGGGFNHSVFIYNNGLMVNSFYGGTGSSTQPALITGMPQLNLSYNVNSAFNPFSIKFSDLQANSSEFMISEAGTDNGYIRSKDGACNTWVKSSASVNHTPATTNGPSIESSGTVTITGIITRGISPATTSSVTYDVTAGSSTAFPLQLQAYIDNGSVPGQLDATDTHISTTVQNAVSDLPITKVFSPLSANILVVAKTAAGCYGQVKLVTTGANVILPVKLLSFESKLVSNTVSLTWQVEDNETVNKFEIEKSYDGVSFTKLHTVFGTKLFGAQTYKFQDVQKAEERTYYRLRMIDVQDKQEFSKVIAVNYQNGNIEAARLLQNPVSNNIAVNYTGEKSGVVTMKVYDLNGRERIRKDFQVLSGDNRLMIDLQSTINNGVYVLSIVQAGSKQQMKFIKK